MKAIVVENNNPDWAKEFSLLKETFEMLLGGYNISIEHVGSTSVSGLAAKPIIDIDIISYDTEERADIIKKLSQVGYKHLGDLGITGREAFRREASNVPIYENNTYQFAHNLYVCQEDSLALRNHLMFRDYLRSNKEDVVAYAALKKALAIKYPDNIDAYCEAKTDFITNILKKAGLDEAEVDDITNQNRLD